MHFLWLPPPFHSDITLTNSHVPMQHNKKREELHRLKEKYPDVAARVESKLLSSTHQNTSSDRQNRYQARTIDNTGEEDDDTTSSSDDEEDDDGFISNKTEAQILETLVKIRRKDKSIYDEKTKFYSSEDDDDDDDIKKRGKKDKPMYLKDVLYKEAMEQAAKDDDDDDLHDDDKPQIKTYDQEQQDLKNAFLTAFNEEVEDDDGDAIVKTRAFGGVLKPKQKSKSGGDDDRGDVDDEHDARVQSLLDQYFKTGHTKKKQKENPKGRSSNENDLNEEDAFLRNFILNKAWIEKDDEYDDDDNDDVNGGGDTIRRSNNRWNADGDGGDYASGMIDADEDEVAWEAAEAFEAKYNFRFEEPGGRQLVTHPRVIEDTVRKEDDRRKRKRAEKAERKALEEEKRKTEVRRLKNLKKAEIQERLDEVKEVAGAGAPPEELLDQLLAGEFDPEAHDRAMAAAFGDEYYGEEGDEDEDDLADELFEKELQDMAQYDSQDDEKGNTFAGLQRKLAAAERSITDDPDDAAAVAVREELQKLVQEYHKLDYEDHVGGIPTRFRYKEVQPEDYGMTLEEILKLEDKDLNQVIGLKRVTATYRQGRVRPNYGKLNEMRKEKRSEQERSTVKRRRDSDSGGGDGGGIQEKEGVEQSEREKRLASFAPPKLRKKSFDGVHGGGARETFVGSSAVGRNSGGGGGGKYGTGHRRSTQQQHSDRKQPHKSENQETVTGTMSKAQKKNLKRSEKRASKRKVENDL